jgi:Leucine-rich repeat (LRR) protein
VSVTDRLAHSNATAQAERVRRQLSASSSRLKPGRCEPLQWIDALSTLHSDLDRAEPGARSDWAPHAGVQANAGTSSSRNMNSAGR